MTQISLLSLLEDTGSWVTLKGSWHMMDKVERSRLLVAGSRTDNLLGGGMMVAWGLEIRRVALPSNASEQPLGQDTVYTKQALPSSFQGPEGPEGLDQHGNHVSQLWGSH